MLRRMLQRLRRMLASPAQDPGIDSRRQALAETARRHLSSLDRARRVLPNDPVIEAEYARLERMLSEGRRR